MLFFNLLVYFKKYLSGFHIRGLFYIVFSIFRHLPEKYLRLQIIAVVSQVRPVAYHIPIIPIKGIMVRAKENTTLQATSVTPFISENLASPTPFRVPLGT